MMLAISGFGIFLIFLFFLFILASLASQAQKKENQRHGQAMRDAMRAHAAQNAFNRSANDPAPPPIPVEFLAPEKPGPPPPPRQGRGKRAPRPKMRRPAPPPAPPTTPIAQTPASLISGMAAPLPDSSTSVSKPPSLKLTAEQLRRQYVLIELFRPPVALRDDSAS